MANFLILRREICLPEWFLYGPVSDKATLIESYTIELAQQLQLQKKNRQEALFFEVEQHVVLKKKGFSKEQSHKLQPKCSGLYTIHEAARNHTYVIEQHGRPSREAESRLKVYHLSEHPVGQISTLVEPTRQLERKALPRKTGGQMTAYGKALPRIVQPKSRKLEKELEKQQTEVVKTAEKNHCQQSSLKTNLLNLLQWPETALLTEKVEV